MFIQHMEGTEGFHWHLCSHGAGVIDSPCKRNLWKEPAEDAEDQVDALNCILFLTIGL